MGSNEIQSNLKLSSYCNKNCLIDEDNAPRENPNIVGNFRIGLGDTDLDRSLEDILRTMYPGEISDVSVRLNLDLTKRQHILELVDSKKENKSEETALNHWITLHMTLCLRHEGYANRPAIYNWHYMEKTKEANKVYLCAVKLFQVLIELSTNYTN